MTKILALLMVLSLMVSCASYKSDRGISSVDKHEGDNGYYERTGMGDRF